ncbi:MAG: ferritin [Bacteroidia bacterium]
MVSKTLENALNQQIELEAASSQYYLAMASWAETQDLKGVAAFLYTYSNEERGHMLKLVKYINERSGKALIPAVKKQPQNFESVQYVFEENLKPEILVSIGINNLVDICLKQKEYTTHNFL